jgi:ABC-2 type transport system ATP-binding protein
LASDNGDNFHYPAFLQERDQFVERWRSAQAQFVDDPAGATRDHRARVGLMLQGGGGIDPRAQPRETLRQYGRFHADPRDADELLDLVGLVAVARTRYRRLSGGERQRLGLALALVGRPEVVLLDEPTAGMDPEARAATRAIVAGLRDDGAAVLLTSHDLTDVERLADRICVLDGGRIVAAGTPTELSAGATPRLRFRLDRPLAEAELADLGGALAAVWPGATVRDDGGGGRYRVDDVPPDPRVVAALAAWCLGPERLIVDLATSGGSLEDVYLGLVAAGRDAAATASPASPGTTTSAGPRGDP